MLDLFFEFIRFIDSSVDFIELTLSVKCYFFNLGLNNLILLYLKTHQNKKIMFD